MFREPRSWPDARIESLAARVRWLDRYRRLLALAAAAVAAPFMMAQLAEGLGAEWPEMHATVLSLMLGVIVWWIFEIGLVYVTALWETEHDRRVRDHSLPRAVLYKPRRGTTTR
jgi:hypothetical protein